MELLKNLEEFQNIFRIGKKWQRCREAIANQSNIQAYRYYSIGDSIIYMLTDGKHEVTENFIGHRRYMDVHYYLQGTQKLEITKKELLTPIEPYSDKTDYEYFTGKGDMILLEVGNLIIIQNDEAFCFVEGESVKKIIFKVTVESNYFLNK
ncbi:MAG: beta-galactosidase subunit beta [Brevinema sp.]